MNVISRNFENLGSAFFCEIKSTKYQINDPSIDQPLLLQNEIIYKQSKVEIDLGLP